FRMRTYRGRFVSMARNPLKKGFLARASSQNPGVSIRKFEFPDGNYLTFRSTPWIFLTPTPFLI
ncbi:MAG: hypothetical protein V2B13_14330, partial [Pseudomonadota bacterium]